MTLGRRTSSDRALWRQLLRGLCVVSLALVAFAHQPVAPSGDSAFDAAAFTLPDGTLPTLCATGPDGEEGSAVGSEHCESCRLAGSILLPRVACTVETPRRTVAWSPARNSHDAGRSGFQPATPLRGPPHA